MVDRVTGTRGGAPSFPPEKKKHSKQLDQNIAKVSAVAKKMIFPHFEEKTEGYSNSPANHQRVGKFVRVFFG